MRRLALSVLVAAAALVAASIVTVTTPAGALGLVDLSASATANPALAVSPPGSLVIYTATFKNEGSIEASGVFTNTTSNGKLIRASAGAPATCTVPAALTSDPAISCNATLAAGQSFAVRVVIQSPATAGAVITNTSKARATDALYQTVDDVQDLVIANNSKTVTTQVTASNTAAGSAAFVQEGGTLSYKKHVLTVRAADLGVVAYLSDVPAPQTADCGGTPCNEGLRAEFDQDPSFFGLVAIDVNFGTGDPCRGLGNGSCHPLFFRKGPLAPTAPILACGSQGADDPCLESTYKGGTEFHFVVVLQTDDPDLLSPVKSLVNANS